MSVFRRLVNVAYGKVKTTISADEGPVVDEVERLRPPAPEPEPEREGPPAGDAVVERPKEPVRPKPRRL